ncbi:unnamed protein product [Blepharisma stoltei]|uniref:Uncharacterized protein n=1 Tax=Blepharisma stoltei TaxID=1481888 RepID=A0AAU9JKK1_9CILI|nr:unnamed protein product [Blepharisma stoltei]
MCTLHNFQSMCKVSGMGKVLSSSIQHRGGNNWRKKLDKSKLQHHKISSWLCTMNTRQGMHSMQSKLFPL